MEADLDSEDDVADSHPRDPWIAILIVMFTITFLHMVGLSTTQPCSPDFVQQIVGCTDGAYERCSATMTTEGCR